MPACASHAPLGAHPQRRLLRQRPLHQPHRLARRRRSLVHLAERSGPWRRAAGSGASRQQRVARAARPMARTAAGPSLPRQRRPLLVPYLDRELPREREAARIVVLGHGPGLVLRRRVERRVAATVERRATVEGNNSGKEGGGNSHGGGGSVRGWEGAAASWQAVQGDMLCRAAGTPAATATAASGPRGRPGLVARRPRRLGPGRRGPAPRPGRSGRWRLRGRDGSEEEGLSWARDGAAAGQTRGKLLRATFSVPRATHRRSGPGSTLAG